MERVRVPNDPCVRVYWELNRELRPEWEAKVLAWVRRNNLELEGIP